MAVKIKLGMEKYMVQVQHMSGSEKIVLRNLPQQHKIRTAAFPKWKLTKW